MNKDLIKFPLNSSKLYLQDKKCNYVTLAFLTLYSELNEDNRRFIYYEDIKNLSDIEIQKFTGLKKDTILRNIKKLRKLNNDLITAENTINGIIFYINYNYNNEFVTIEKDILKSLINIGNSNIIKTYILLKYLCKNNSKEIHRAYIAECIGLSPNKNNLRIVTEATDTLEKLNLIKKRTKYKTIILDNNKEQYTQVNEYRLCNYTQWYCYMINNQLDLMKKLDMYIGSKGELSIMDYLDNESIKYIREYSFDDLRSDKGGLLRFDFYLPDENILIEFNGKQHDRYVEFIHKDKQSFNSLKRNDELKNLYAKNNNIKLIKIDYDDMKNIESILNKEIV